MKWLGESDRSGDGHFTPGRANTRFPWALVATGGIFFVGGSLSYLGAAEYRLTPAPSGDSQIETDSPASAPKAEPPSDWKITLAKDGDQVKITPQKEGVVIDIASRTGIGRAVMERLGPGWPKKVLLRLHLRGLESFRLQAGQWGVEASVMSYPPYKTRVRVHVPEPIPPLDPKSPYWVEVRMVDSEGKPASKIPLDGGYFELIIPSAFLEKSPPKWELHWIDFYRD